MQTISKVTSTRLTNQLQDKFNQLCERLEVSESELVKIMVADFIDRRGDIDQIELQKLRKKLFELLF